MIDLSEHVTTLSEGNYEVSASIYPAIIAEIQRIVGMDPSDQTQELSGYLSPLSTTYLSQARNIDASAWDMALEPVSEGMSEQSRAARAEALELARLWFTEVMHQNQAGGGMTLRIKKDDQNTYAL